MGEQSPNPSVKGLCLPPQFVRIGFPKHSWAARPGSSASSESSSLLPSGSVGSLSPSCFLSESSSLFPSGSVGSLSPSCFLVAVPPTESERATHSAILAHNCGGYAALGCVQSFLSLVCPTRGLCVPLCGLKVAWVQVISSRQKWPC